MTTGENNDTDNDLTDEHARAAGQSQGTSSDFVDEEDCGDCDGDVDDTSNTRSKKCGGSILQTKGSEDNRSVIDNYLILALCSW
jgi:hypothetical protein